MALLARTDLPEELQRRLTVYRASGALVLIAVWGWFALVRNDPTPVFVYLNIAVHETGHVLFRPFGELPMLIMGSGFEVFFPLLAGAAFLAWKRDVVAAAVCWGWAASALASAATYIADADDGALMLLGGGPDGAGDWERILGEGYFDAVYMADRIAVPVRTAGYVLWFVAMGVAVWAIVADRRAERAAAGPTRAAAAKAVAPQPQVSDEQMWR
ncbi:MAG: hypothetical protein ACXWWX_05220 [Actinomycetota bacterium]